MNHIDIEKRSGEVQKLMNQIPGKILLWGNTIIFLIVISSIIIVCFFNYSDVVKSEIIINTTRVNHNTFENKGVLIMNFEGSEKIRNGYPVEVLIDNYLGRNQGRIKGIITEINANNLNGEHGEACVNFTQTIVADNHKYLPDSNVFLGNAKIIVGKTRLLTKIKLAIRKNYNKGIKQ